MFEPASLDDIRRALKRLRQLNRTPTAGDIQAVLSDTPRFLDVCPVLLTKSPEVVAEKLHDQLGESEKTWSCLHGIATRNPARIAQALVAIGMLEVLADHFHPRLQLEHVLIQRHKAMCKKPPTDEDDARAIRCDLWRVLDKNEIPFEYAVTLVGRDSRNVDCDFAIPTREHPKIVIEAKPFESIQAKFPEYLEDVLDIAAARDGYFLLLTDGLGWHSRKGDLDKLVRLQNYGVIDMIYTRARLGQLAHDVKHIHENE